MTNNRAARKIAVIGQKGPLFVFFWLFVVADENDNKFYDKS